jgi:carotenoid cleavage dioxygenase
MNRRHFLQRSLTATASLSLASWARADEATLRDFAAGARQNPRLAALASVDADMLAGDAAIEGRWPTDLAGVFYRSGPARLEQGGERYEHWFDGDGMVHAWHIRDGRVRHTARMVRTAKYQAESAAGRFLYPAFGTAIDRAPIRNNDSMNTANTNAVPHAGKLYALWEGGSATELDSTTLATRSIKTWRDDLAALPFSAHPKLTPDGRLWNFGALPGLDKLVLWRIEPDGSLGGVGMLPIPQLAMVHDFVVTERHMVFLVPPYHLEPKAGASFLAQHVWDAGRPIRAVVVDKADFSLRRIIEQPVGPVFHFGNGWDDGDKLHLDACLYDDDRVLAELGAAMHGQLWDDKVSSRATLLTLDLARGTVRSEMLLGNSEFPRVAPADVGQRHRQLYLATSRQARSMGLDGVARIDLDHGQVDRYDFGADWVVEEHIPVPKANGRGVWLIGPAFDARHKTTVLNLFDGERIAAGPVARARLPYAAPMGFHGNFLRA